MIKLWNCRYLCLLLPGIMCLSQALSQRALPEKPTITVYVTVSEKRVSQPIETPPQIVVSVDKQPVPVDSIRSADKEKMLFALLVDISGSDAKKAKLIKQAASNLFKRLSELGNEGYLVVFNDRIQTSKRTAQPSEVQGTLDGVRFGGATALNDAIAVTCATILSASRNPATTRRAIFLITDGEDNASSLNREVAVEAAEKEGVPIFFLQTGFEGMSYGEKDRTVRLLDDDSNNTGGRAILAKNLEEGVQSVIDAVNEQWAIRFRPAQDYDHKMHPLAITSEDNRVKISAPRQIVLP